jgi:hypothetical protein
MARGGAPLRGRIGPYGGQRLGCDGMPGKGLARALPGWQPAWIARISAKRTEPGQRNKHGTRHP